MMQDIISETIARNTLWVLHQHPELASLEPTPTSDYRLAKTFEASKISYRILRFLYIFRKVAFALLAEPCSSFENQPLHDIVLHLQVERKSLQNPSRHPQGRQLQRFPGYYWPAKNDEGVVLQIPQRPHESCCQERLLWVASESRAGNVFEEREKA